MKRVKSFLAGFLAVIVAFAVFPAVGGGTEPVSSDIWVERVPGLRPDFIMGADIGSVISIEESIANHPPLGGRAAFRNASGQPSDLFAELNRGGVNWVRARIWNDPWLCGCNNINCVNRNCPGHGNRVGFGAGNTDVAKAIEIGRRATAEGMRMLANFHYSDFWADPNKQTSPRAWAGMNITQRAAALYTYTFDSVLAILRAGVDLGMVQIGNETNSGMAGITGNMANVTPLFAAGSRAIRNAERQFRNERDGTSWQLIPAGAQTLNDGFAPDVLIAIHHTSPGNWHHFTGAATRLQAANVDFDVIGISYYPFWDGPLDNLTALMEHLVQNFGVYVSVFETAWPFTTHESDGTGNNWQGNTAQLAGLERQYPVSPQGQANAVRDVIAAVASVEGGLGVFYWEPAWITISPHRVNTSGANWQSGTITGLQSNTWTYNRPRWISFGSGWSSGTAAGYDPEVPSEPGGSSWDNKAMFNHRGEPLPSLNVWRYVRTGAYAPTDTIDLLMDGHEISVGAGLSVAQILANHMPSGLEAVFASNRRYEVPVTWNSAQIQNLIDRQTNLGGIQRADIGGTVTYRGQTLPARVTLVLTPGNLARNPGFESADMSMWNIVNRQGASGHAERRGNDVRSGDFALAYWRGAGLPIDFTVTQTFTGLPAGYYGFNLHHMGDNWASGGDVFIFAQINGAQVAGATVQRLSWPNWANPSITNIRVETGDTVTIGITVNRPNNGGTGGWGSIDDVHFHAISLDNDPPRPRVPIVVQIYGNGSVTGDGYAYVGDLVTLVAAPSAGWEFGGWYFHGGYTHEFNRISDYPTHTFYASAVAVGRPFMVRFVESAIPSPTDFIVGDANGDGRVTSADVTAIARHLQNPAVVGICALSADVNGDGYVCSEDLLLLARWLVGHRVGHLIAH